MAETGGVREKKGLDTFPHKIHFGKPTVLCPQEQVIRVWRAHNTLEGTVQGYAKKMFPLRCLKGRGCDHK